MSATSPPVRARVRHPRDARGTIVLRLRDSPSVRHALRMLVECADERARLEEDGGDALMARAYVDISEEVIDALFADVL